MERRTFLKGLIGAAALAVLPAKWLEGPVLNGRIRVAHPKFFHVKDVVHVPRTGESMIVTSIEKNWLSVTRGLGTQVEEPIKDGDPIWIVGSMEPVDSKEGIPAPLSFPSEGLIGSDWQQEEVFANVDVIESGA